MPVLRNARQEKFAQELVKGKTAVSAYEAAGYARHAASAWALRRKPHVAARIKELLERAAARAEVTGGAGAARAGADRLCQHAGLCPDRAKHLSALLISGSASKAASVAEIGNQAGKAGAA